MPSPYQGLNALITGASYGIGASFARHLAKEGANLILTARSKDKLEDLAVELERGFGVKVHVFISDLTFADAPRLLYDAISRAGLQVDILINNAGFGYCDPFISTTLERNDTMIQLNIASLVQLTHLFLKPMLDRGQGGILNVASTAGYQPLPKMAVYAATKAFVLHFSEALWAENKNKNIRIFCVSPGNTESQFHRTAGIQPRRIFFSATADNLVRFALYNFAYTSKPSAVHGLRNSLLTFGNRLLPRRAVLAVTSQIYK